VFESPKRHQFSLTTTDTSQNPNSFARTLNLAGEAGGKQEESFVQTLDDVSASISEHLRAALSLPIGELK
jgi:hypothetical protein